MPAPKNSKKTTVPPAKKVIAKKAAANKKAAITPAKKTITKKGAPKGNASAKPVKTASKRMTLTSNFPVIPVEEAVVRTQQWCDYNMDLYSNSGRTADFARAFFVGKEDIQALHQMFQEDSNLIGCRMYMGMQPELGSNGFVWSICLVAVEHSNTSVNGIDIVRAPNSGESMVFDFSRPCPSTCDFQSELYHTPPPQAKAGKSKNDKKN